MNLLIIDDEYRARKGLMNQIEALYPNEHSIKEAEGVQDGLVVIKETSPDIVFLDIHMEDGSGFDLLKSLPRKKFQLIFTTAYDQHAIKAFEEDAMSYLLKPISPKKLADAIDKALERIRNENSLKMLDTFANQQSSQDETRVKLPVSNGVRFIDFDKVIYVKAEGNYFRLFLESDEESILISKTLRYFEAQMNNDFMRVHKSYIVNLNKVSKYSRSDGGTLTLSNSYEVPISVKFKTDFLSRVRINV